MFRDKIQEIRNARKRFRDIRAELKKQEKNFCCYDTRNMVCSGDPCHAIPDLEPCLKYDRGTCCQDKGCPHNKWNSKHYKTYQSFCVAEWDLLNAYFNLLKRGK